MRKKLIGLFVLAGFAAVLLIPALNLNKIGAQPGGAGGKKGGKGGAGGAGGGKGGKGGAFGGAGADFGAPGGATKAAKNGGIGNLLLDPDRLWDSIARGEDAILIASSGMLKPYLEQFAEANQLTSGIITRDEFYGFAQMMTDKLRSSNLGGLGGNVDTDKIATTAFQRADKNSDGFLTEDEMPQNLKAVWTQYDANRDGLIDLSEYINFYRVAATSQGRGKGGAGGIGQFLPLLDDLDAKPAVYRAGKLPPGLPVWFAQLDRDKDGQVGLYEWRDGGKPIMEFQIMDRNGDGLLTAEEVMWFLKIPTANSLNDATNQQPQGKWVAVNNGANKGVGGVGGAGKKGGAAKGGAGAYGGGAAAYDPSAYGGGAGAAGGKKGGAGGKKGGKGGGFGG